MNTPDAPNGMSPVYVGAIIINTLRWFFHNYSDEDLRWDPDPLKSKIEIDSINNFNKVAIQVKPRILISRGGYTVDTTTGISAGMSAGKSYADTLGLRDSEYLAIISGMAQLNIEARNEGTVEKVTDFVQHFLTWSAYLICETGNFRTFAAPNMSISPCVPSREDTEIFQVSVGIPWSKEERYRFSNDGVILKQLLLQIGS